MQAAELPLLLHSVREFASLIGALFATVRPARVIEIGGESGQGAACYIEAGAGEVVCVDPRPDRSLVEMAAREPRLRLAVDRSPDCIESLPPAAAWVLDGDHNYATVRAELEAILDRGADPQPLLILHDVLWPCGRRDLYYEPAALAESDVHPHRWDAGPSIGHEELRKDGLVGRGSFAAATEAGGERNGVRTALEDVLAARPGLECALIPVLFGLAVVYDRNASWAEEVRERLRPLDRSPLLTRLELNRIALYCRVLELQHLLDGDRGDGRPDSEATQ
jgi:Methyltransferase domain